MTVNLVGLAGLAAINVVGILFRPVRIMITAWGRAALPELAALWRPAGSRRSTACVARAFAGGDRRRRAGCVVLWLGWGPIERHFLAGKYPEAWLAAAGPGRLPPGSRR